MVNRCKCGCNTILPSKDKRGRIRKYVLGHQSKCRNYTPTKESIQKGIETKKRNNPNGLIPWNKGLTKFTNEKIKLGSIKTGLMNRGNNNPNIKNISIPELNIQFAYILGCLCGDASIISKKSFNRINWGVIRLACKDKDFALAFKKCLDYLFNDSFFRINGVYYVGINSTSLVREIVNRWGYFKTKDWRIPLEIKNANQHIKTSFLKGLFDSDASVSEKGYIRIQKINKQGLKEVYDLLNSLNINSNFEIVKRRTIKNNKVYMISINKLKDRTKFYKMIGFEILRKNERLLNSL